MKARRAAELIRDNVAPHWHELRAAAVQRRMMDGLRQERPPVRRRAWLLAALGALAALATVLFFLWREDTTRLELSDGSMVVLDASARVVAEMVTPERIELRQTAGAASYDVVPDAKRTFVVRVDDVRVEVVGTAFRIERQAGSIHVAVSRGRVNVIHGARVVTLGAGEDITLANGATPVEGEPAEEPAPPGEASSAPSASAPPVEGSAAALPSASSRAEAEGAAELFRRADDARAAGDVAGALGRLRELIARYPKDGRVTMATFTIGRLEEQRGNHAAAASAFEACGASFGGEALAEAAFARSAAGQAGQARALARRYLGLFPDGPRAKALGALAK